MNNFFSKIHLQSLNGIFSILVSYITVIPVCNASEFVVLLLACVVVTLTFQMECLCDLYSPMKLPSMAIKIVCV